MRCLPRVFAFNITILQTFFYLAFPKWEMASHPVHPSLNPPLSHCGKTLASKTVIPTKSTIGKKTTNTQMLTGPLGLLALQAPWYKLNDDHGSLTYGSNVSREKKNTERIRFFSRLRIACRRPKSKHPALDTYLSH